MQIRLVTEYPSTNPPGGAFPILMTEGQTVASAVWLSGHAAPRALCSGLGRCGACRVRFISEAPPPVAVELETLSPCELENGVRLGCRHAAQAGMVLDIPERRLSAEQTETQTPRLRHEFFSASCGKICKSGLSCDDAPSVLRLAVDLGTTSIHWRADDAHGPVAAGRELNPQLGAGSNVMSRVALALQPEGRTRLRSLVLDELARMVAALPLPVSETCVAGNTAMTAILLDADCTGLAATPYSRPETGGRETRLPELPQLGRVWIPPQPAPFVGGDISAGLACLLARPEPPFPFLLADMGTNGEFALMPDAQTLFLTSVPLGPSLEGIGLRHGVMAGTGAVVDFALGPAGLIPRLWPRSETVSGVSGTGYLSLLHVLRQVGVLSPTGALADTPPHPLGRRLLAAVERPSGRPWRLPLPHGLYLYATDVEELVKVRAAFALAVSRLLAAADLPPSRLKNVFVAGALGEHVFAPALEGLGFLPAGLGARLHSVGNTSLAGAALLLREPRRRDPLIRLCRNAVVLDLTSAPDFMDAYVAHMRLDEYTPQ